MNKTAHLPCLEQNLSQYDVYVPIFKHETVLPQNIKTYVLRAKAVTNSTLIKTGVFE